jgi:hypothetical protein
VQLGGSEAGQGDCLGQLQFALIGFKGVLIKSEDILQ